jgi:hypothetical protein
VISSVEKWVNKRLTSVRLDAVRANSYATNITNYHIRKDRTVVMLQNAFYEHGFTSEQAIAMAISAWNNVYTVAKIKREFRKMFPAHMKMVVAKQSTNSHIIIKMAAGVYGQTRASAGKTLKDGSISRSKQKLVNGAMMGLWKSAMKEAERVAKKMGSNRDANIGHKGQGNHGELGKVDRNGLKSADQSTIAAVSVGQDFDREMDSIFTSLSSEYPSKLREVEEVIKHYADSFEREYKISDKQKFTETGFEREIGIDIFYGSQLDNKDADIGRADKPGIQAFIEEERNAIIKKMKPDLLEMLDLEGSKTPRAKLKAIVPAMYIKNLFPHKSRPDMRFKVNKKLLATAKKMKGKKTTSTAFKAAITKATSKLVAAKTGTKKRPKNKRATGKTGESPIALRNLLNELLPQMVASKMTSPALQFRTGRFANSARVENVNIGPRGGMHIDYTYMKAPYETFEPGGKQGSTQRDPRKIIGASLRELAQGIIGRQPSSIRRN